MKYFYAMIYLTLCLFLLSGSLHAQEWRVVLVSGETFHNARLERLSGDTLIVATRHRDVAVDVRDLHRLRRITGTRAGEGAAIGAAAFAGVTVSLYLLVRTLDRGQSDNTNSILYIGVPVTAGVGALIGASIGQFSRDEENYDLSTMPLTERAMFIEWLISNEARDRK